MADGVDTSSYPKASLPAEKSMIDKIQGFQALESNQLGISKQKLDLVNQGYTYLMRELQSVDPNFDHTNKDAVRATMDGLITGAQNAVKQKLIKPEMFAAFVKSIPTDPSKLSEFIHATRTKLSETQAAINYHAGNFSFVHNGNTLTPTLTSPKFGAKPAGAPIALQLPPETETTTPGGTQKLGPQPPQIPQGTVQKRGGLPAQYEPQGNSPQTNQPQTPTGPATSQAPLFEEGRKALTDDQALSTQRRTSNIRLKSALKLMPGLTSGIGTRPFNEAVAAAKNAGILGVDTNEKDPTAVYQQVNKYLNQAIVESGNRSDADLLAKEAGSPNITKQISPALTALTRKQIVFNRIDAARAGAFKDKDLSKYGQHRSRFPSTIDERAAGIDLMPADKRNELLDDMKTKANTPAGKKFWDTLRLFKEEKLFNEDEE